MRQEATFTPIKVKDYRVHYDYWECYVHKVVFEPEDSVLLKTLGNTSHLVCPLKISTVQNLRRGLFSNKKELVSRTCCEGLCGADKDWYEERYKITEPHQ